MDTLLGVIVFIVALAFGGFMTAWRVKGLKPDWAKINARRRSQGKSPFTEDR